MMEDFTKPILIKLVHIGRSDRHNFWRKKQLDWRLKRSEWVEVGSLGL